MSKMDFPECFLPKHCEGKRTIASNHSENDVESCITHMETFLSLHEYYE